ncbi:MAG: orotidine-5'-phosphate decarboxylase [Vampirovibrio sp.]|nr:orotidine-5'-phosphate decarboxylase [Vampirovibrio sp.]
MNTDISHRLIVALDVDNAETARGLVEKLAPLHVTYKVGMQLFYREGVQFVRELIDAGHLVFVDLKLHDIPNTVAGAVQTLVSQGVLFFNVHCLGGTQMMEAAAQAGKKAAGAIGKPPPLIAGVTVLTSMSETVLHDELKINEPLEPYVVSLASSAQACGLGGVVCSAKEASKIRKVCGDDFVLITPGVRPKGSANGDQSRIVTPQMAIEAGATYIVVGRPITQAPDPAEAAARILEEMSLVGVSQP